MKTFFSGTIFFLYFISHYLAEPIFIAACLLPLIYAITVALIFRFGSCGRMIAAKNRAKRMVRKGVISGERREAFYRKCIKGTAPEARAAYRLFTEGRMDVEEMRLILSRSVRSKGGLLKGGVTGIGVISTLSVFLAFYFAVPIGETLVRTALCAFFAALNGVVLHFTLYAAVVASEKAADRLADILDAHVLREKREEMLLSRPTRTEARAALPERDGCSLRDLREILRDLDSRERIG